MNNKGFAVSTILYGLSIMGFLIVLVLIGLMASNRSNTKDFVMQVEDELNRFSSKQTEIMPYKDDHGNINTNYPQEYFTMDGTNAYWYKIELWNGRTYKSSTFKISPNTLIFFYIGNGEDIPTIACLDGEARENCKAEKNNLIMSTGGAGSTGIISQSSDVDVGDGYTREVDTNSKNNYSFTDAHYDQKVRVSLSSMDETGGFLEHPNNNIAGVFYIINGNKVYSCSGTSVNSSAYFTGNQDQQWTIIKGEATNVKYKDCKTNYNLQQTYNALF